MPERSHLIARIRWIDWTSTLKTADTRGRKAHTQNIQTRVLDAVGEALKHMPGKTFTASYIANPHHKIVTKYKAPKLNSGNCLWLRMAD